MNKKGFTLSTHDLFTENDSFGPDAEGIYPGYYHNGNTCLSHPYSYDPYYVWRNNTRPNNTYYSDHLYSWDYKKHDELCQKHFGNQGQYWRQRNPEKIQEFLREYSGNPNLILCRVIEYCNKSNGYPVWRFDTFEKTNTTKKEPTMKRFTAALQMIYKKIEEHISKWISRLAF